MTIDASIANFYANVQTVPTSKRYWLIRTLSGELYDTFIAHNYISIGYNEISLEAIDTIKKGQSDKANALRNIKNLVEDTYPDEKRPGLIGNQIFQFTYELKRGDVVVIPSKNSSSISFGVIEETPLMVIDYDRLGDCPFYRRKKVKWLKHLNRNNLEPLLFKMFFSHNTVNDISLYGDLIESTLSNYFIKDDKEHVIFNIQRNEGIGAIDLFQLGFYLLTLTEEFFEENGLAFDVNNFDVKVNLNSKGKLKFIGQVGQGAFLLAVITVFLNGGGGSFVMGASRMEVSTDGLIQKIIDYQNNEFDREMVREIQDSMDTLKIENPEDALEMYRQFSVNKRSGQE